MSDHVRAPSMRDVARLSGVTYQTVSRVVNDSPRVSPETRIRVRAAIEQLGYRPNGAARTLASGKSQMIGILSLGASVQATPSTIEGIDMAAAEAGYSLSIAASRSSSVTETRRAVSRLIDQRVDGCVLITPLVSIDVDELNLPTSLPVVAVEGDPRAKMPGVNLDQFAGGRMATEHLLSLGHRSVWHVSGPPDWFDSRERQQGWRTALEAVDVTPPPVLVGDWTAASGYEAGRVLAGVADATAVFVANDTTALGLIRALDEGGRRVPEDVSVVGFDDLPDTAYYRPPLTTVRQRFFDIGRASIRLLLDQIEGRGEQNPRQRVDTTLVVRASTARPHQ